MALQIDHGAFDLINVKSPICPGFGGGGGGGGVARTTDRCIKGKQVEHAALVL